MAGQRQIVGRAQQPHHGQRRTDLDHHSSQTAGVGVPGPTSAAYPADRLEVTRSRVRRTPSSSPRSAAAANRAPSAAAATRVLRTCSAHGELKDGQEGQHQQPRHERELDDRRVLVRSSRTDSSRTVHARSARTGRRSTSCGWATSHSAVTSPAVITVISTQPGTSPRSSPAARSGDPVEQPGSHRSAASPSGWPSAPLGGVSQATSATTRRSRGTTRTRRTPGSTRNTTGTIMEISLRAPARPAPVGAPRERRRPGRAARRRAGCRARARRPWLRRTGAPARSTAVRRHAREALEQRLRRRAHRASARPSSCASSPGRDPADALQRRRRALPRPRPHSASSSATVGNSAAMRSRRLRTSSVSARSPPRTPMTTRPQPAQQLDDGGDGAAVTAQQPDTSATRRAADPDVSCSTRNSRRQFRRASRSSRACNRVGRPRARGQPSARRGRRAPAQTRSEQGVRRAARTRRRTAVEQPRGPETGREGRGTRCVQRAAGWQQRKPRPATPDDRQREAGGAEPRASAAGVTAAPVRPRGAAPMRTIRR